MEAKLESVAADRPSRSIPQAQVPTGDTRDPLYYFFYGTLTRPEILKRVLGLEVAPDLRKAKVFGYSLTNWGQYKALVDGELADEVEGFAAKVESAEHQSKLAYYETSAYKLAPCQIHFSDEGEPKELAGKTFMYAGDAEALKAGRFDRTLWELQMGTKLPAKWAYTRLPIPPDAPIELRASPGKGWGVFVTEDIKANSQIVGEDPLFVVTAVAATGLSNDISKPFTMFSKTHIKNAFQQLNAEKKTQFLSLRDNGAERFQGVVDAFEDNMLEVLPDGEDGPSREGLYVVMSRFNHSCVPNARVPSFKGGYKSIVAIRDISAGEEITHMYDKWSWPCWTSLERNQALPFKCGCLACAPGTPYQLLSDLRRRLIRGLYYLVAGNDKDPGNLSPSSLIPDPGLRKTAEDHTTPSTSRFVHGTLMQGLMEKEGLMDTSGWSRAIDNTDHSAMMLTTASNRRIAKRAQKQETRLLKFCVAVEMYGLPDAGDQMATMVLKMARKFYYY